MVTVVSLLEGNAEHGPAFRERLSRLSLAFARQKESRETIRAFGRVFARGAEGKERTHAKPWRDERNIWPGVGMVTSRRTVIR